MEIPANPYDDPIYADFNVTTEVYKTVEYHDIKADILIPKLAQPGKHPLIIEFHGGALIAGSRNFLTFINKSAFALALAQSAIMISADHRLLPQANGADILSDVYSLWDWIQIKLPSIIASTYPGYEVDLSHVLAQGGSAGGFAAMALAMKYPDQIRAVFTFYPMLDLGGVYFRKGPQDNTTVFHMPRESFLFGPAFNDAMDKAIAEGPVSDGATPERLQLFGSLIMNGNEKWFGEVEEGYLLDRAKKGVKLPKRIWILHSDGDTVVPLQGSEDFVKAVEEKAEGTEIKLYVDRGGKDHGFDSAWPANAPVLEEGLPWIVEAWLGDR